MIALTWNAFRSECNGFAEELRLLLGQYNNCSAANPIFWSLYPIDILAQHKQQFHLELQPQYRITWVDGKMLVGNKGWFQSSKKVSFIYFQCTSLSPDAGWEVILLKQLVQKLQEGCRGFGESAEEVYQNAACWGVSCKDNLKIVFSGTLEPEWIPDRGI